MCLHLDTNHIEWVGEIACQAAGGRGRTEPLRQRERCMRRHYSRGRESVALSLCLSILYSNSVCDVTHDEKRERDVCDTVRVRTGSRFRLESLLRIFKQLSSRMQKKESNRNRTGIDFIVIDSITFYVISPYIYSKSITIKSIPVRFFSILFFAFSTTIV